MKQNLIFTNDVENAISHLIADSNHNMTVCIADVNTARFALGKERLIVIPDGDTGKSLATVCRVWDALEEFGATRHSLVINLGGGMVTDLGGFAAATFKRGMRFINVPTTLLGAVDAAVGGKTGFNYNGLKNEIGAFAPASDVNIYTLLRHLTHSGIEIGICRGHQARHAGRPRRIPAPTGTRFQRPNQP